MAFWTRRLSIRIYKDQFGVERQKCAAPRSGLLSPNKGIETVLRALPEVVKKFPDLVYIILGATHPNLVREHGEAYRLTLERLAKDLGDQAACQFLQPLRGPEGVEGVSGRGRYLYHRSYLERSQSHFDTLAYAFGTGKAVISTLLTRRRNFSAMDSASLFLSTIRGR